MTKEQEKAHERIETLFEDIKALSKVDTERAREAMMMVLNLIKKEYNKIK